MNKHTVLQETPAGLRVVLKTDDWTEAKRVATEMGGIVEYFSDGWGEFVCWTPEDAKRTA